MKYNALLRRKNIFEPVTVILEMEIPDKLSQEKKEDFAAPFLVAEAGLYVDLEPIVDEKPHGNTKNT
jgi:hypothetical protein